VSAYKISKIIIGVILGALIFLIISLLSGSNWVMDSFLYLSDNIICEDRNNDKVDDYCEYWDNGKLIRLEWDYNYDGQPDVWLRIIDGKESFEMDTNFDGKIDYREYDLPDGTVQLEIDTDFNGAFDRKEVLAEKHDLGNK